MQVIGRDALLTLLGVCFTNACVAPYKPPRADQPHAVLKLRRSYETVEGEWLTETVNIDKHAALSDGARSAVVRGPRTGAILVHPVPADFFVWSNFYHRETQVEMESYREPQRSSHSESYSCGNSTCTRMVSETTYETRWRKVFKTVEVSDGGCTRGTRFWPRDGHVYLLQYTYQAPWICSLSCFEQVPIEGGGLRNVACPAPPAAEK